MSGAPPRMLTELTSTLGPAWRLPAVSGLIPDPSGRLVTARQNPELAAAIAEVAMGFDITAAEKADPDIVDSITDMMSVFEPYAKRGGRRGKQFGGGQFTDSVRGLVASIKTKAARIVGYIDSGAAAAVNNIGTIGLIGAVVGVANHPTVVGNTAELLSRVYEMAAEEVTSAGWTEYLAAANQVKDAIVRAGAATASALNGPVGALAIAIAITMYRANKRPDKSVGALLKDDAKYVASLVARGITGQMQAFMTAYEKESKLLGPKRLKEIAEEIERPRGPGAAATSAAAATGAPALRSGPSGEPSVVPGSRTAAMTSDAARNLVGSVGPMGSQNTAAMMRMAAPSSSSSSSSAAPMSEEGGRRRKGKSRKPRGSRKTRRMTRRAKKITALKFVY